MPQANITSNIFEPTVFQEMVNALEPAQGLMLYNSVKKDTADGFNHGWDIHYGASSSVAELNTTNSKANIAPRIGDKISRGIATLAYIREGDRFEFTNSQFLKDPSTPLDSGVILNGEEKIAEQVKHVNDRVNNRIEVSLWQALQGKMSYTGDRTGPIEVDYKFRASHKQVLAAADQWDAATGADFMKIISSIRGAKRVIEVDGGVPVTDVFATRQTIDLLMDAWTKGVIDGMPEKMLSDRQISEYFATGQIKGGFMGVDTWTTVEQYIPNTQADGSVVVESAIPHGLILLGNRSANNALRLVSGPSADFDAPRGHTGRFAKSWLEKDPTGRLFLIEESFLPIITRPDQFATLKVASDTWANAQKWNA